jgi:PAS domain S-box-containing protein
MQSVTDHNLLFGVLALQAGLLDALQFADACSAWATRVNTALADLLVERGWLTTDDRAEVDRLLERKLRKLGSSPAAGGVTPRPPGSSPVGLGTAGTTTTSPLPGGATLPYITSLPVKGYERKNLHATGGMGQIWHAHDPNLERAVAIKELRPDLVEDRQTRERFLREARIMGQLAHPGIVPIHLLGQDEQGTPYYVMKFIYGRTLEEAITAYHQRPSPPAFRDLLRHFGDVCQTIAFAHSRGVIHRDLKPRNIMLGDFGETLVLDWGLAKHLEPGDGRTPVPTSPGSDHGLTQAGQILGTPAYLSPEQATGQAASPISDIYALGVILYEILVGTSPFQGTDTLEILLQVRKGQVTPPSQQRSDIPRGLEEICLKAMACRPSDRYQTAVDLARAVEDWLADELVRSEAALRESEAQVRLLLESTAEAIYGVDLSGNCTFCNPACARLLGLKNPDELLGQHVHRVSHHTRPDGTPYPVEECRIYQAFREGHGTHVKDEVFWRADGTSFPVEYWSYPIRRDGQIIGSVVTFMDITEQLSHERTLVQAQQTAEQACEAARDRLEDWQRQMRGSLDELTTMTGKLLATALSAEQRSYLDKVLMAARALTELMGAEAVPPRDAP